MRTDITIFSSLIAILVVAQTPAELTTYQAFAEHMSEWGYKWESFEVVTSDSWTLTLFHVTGTTADGYFAESDIEHIPLLIQHDQGQDAERWLSTFDDEKPFMLQLASEGYDVWMGNNRGTKYTITPGDNTSAAYWDFNFADMGTYDLPAFID